MTPEEQRFAELWTDYLEGECSEAELAELRHLMERNESLVELAADSFQLHRLLGFAHAPQSSEDFVRETMGQLPADSGAFARNVMARLGSKASRERPDSHPWRPLLTYAGWAVAALLVVGFFLWFPKPAENAVPRSRATFAKLAKARFFGELTPSVASHPELRRDYTLSSGSVELAFPSGATAIVEGPAVFRLVSDERLALDLGQCSTHVPKGAEGFRVDTPVGQVVDKGTRFYVKVSETSDTEVQVIEGAADVYPGGAGDGANYRLTAGEGRKVGHESSVPVAFSQKGYRGGMPDRIVSYEATLNAAKAAETLVSLTVQRGGEEFRYSAGRLIPVEVVSFNAGATPNPIGHLVSGAALPERRASLLEDFALYTGVINPGGSREPLSGPFVPEETPGFAIRFRQPVENRPGPDVAFFEIQNAANSPRGDAFHAGPLRWEDRLRSHTIRQYDLMMTNPAALPVAERYLFRCSPPVLSLPEMEAAEATGSLSSLQFRALVVGIDLSDLGYDIGETVDGLFFQDAWDDDDLVDPVLVVGFPAD